MQIGFINHIDTELDQADEEKDESLKPPEITQQPGKMALQRPSNTFQLPTRNTSTATGGLLGKRLFEELQKGKVFDSVEPDSTVEKQLQNSMKKAQVAKKKPRLVLPTSSAMQSSTSNYRERQDTATQEGPHIEKNQSPNKTPLDKILTTEQVVSTASLNEHLLQNKI